MTRSEEMKNAIEDGHAAIVTGTVPYRRLTAVFNEQDLVDYNDDASKKERLLLPDLPESAYRYDAMTWGGLIDLRSDPSLARGQWYWRVDMDNLKVALS